MEVLINAALVAAGLAMLCYGGNWLVGGGAGIARRLGVSSMMIGMTVVAYGTSTPELAASLAAADGYPGIILGNIIGSNIANVGMVIGISAVIAPLVINRGATRNSLLVMLGATGLLILLSLDGEISGYDGAALMIPLALFTLMTYRSMRRDKEGAREKAPPASRWFYPRHAGMIAGGVALLYAGSRLAVENAVLIAEAFSIPEMIIGITVIAVGTSLPELVTSIIAIRKGHTDIGIGNIIGSNIYNILMIMGIASAITAIPVAAGVYAGYAVMVAFGAALLLVMGRGMVGRRTGLALAAAYAAYLLGSLLYL